MTHSLRSVSIVDVSDCSYLSMFVLVAKFSYLIHQAASHLKREGRYNSWNANVGVIMWFLFEIRIWVVTVNH
jgi:hypothetical protein